MPKKKITASEKKRSEDALEQIRNLCAEFFDHAIILVSKESNGETLFLQSALGNQFAIKGMAETFLVDYMSNSIDSIDGDEEKED
jgi:hypothetical protein